MTMSDDSLFVDTNVLLTATDESRPLHSEALNLLSGITNRDKRLAASGQVVREYLVVATRPIENNGLGLSVTDAEANVTEFLRRLNLYDENEEVSRRLRQLATTHNLRGKRLHDANIVATMAVHGIHTLLTQNGADFAPFNDIAIVAIPDVAVDG
jgi:predicted nucleic acid-binding protein